jgi:hypothetical protein
VWTMSISKAANWMNSADLPVKISTPDALGLL